MTSLADQIRPSLDDIQYKWLQQCPSCDMGLPYGCTHPDEDYRPIMATLAAALLAVLDEHPPCEPPRQLLCNGCHHMEPCPTKVAISAALGITRDGGAA